MPTAKDSKDSKNVMQPAAETSSIWQRMLWGTTLTVGVNNAFDRQPPRSWERSTTTTTLRSTRSVTVTGT